jgi:hypothetical protein
LIAGVGTVLAVVLLDPVRAHSVALRAEPIGDQVLVEAYFSDGTRVRGARVVVRDARGNAVLEGVTDANGQLRFSPPGPEDLSIELHMDAVHTDTFELGAEALADPSCSGPPEDAIAP